jgi:hypothetical protein
MRLGVGGGARCEQVVFALEMLSLLLDVVIESCGIHYERRGYRGIRNCLANFGWDADVIIV